MSWARASMTSTTELARVSVTLASRSLSTANTSTATQGTDGATPQRLSTTVTSASSTTVAEAGNKSSATIGGAVGGAVGLVLILVAAVVWVRRNQVLNRRQRRQNFKVTALPITTMGPEHVPEKTRELSRPQDDFLGPTVPDDQRVDSELLARFDMIMERVARSREVDSPGDEQRTRARGTDSEVLAKLDIIMERVARLEAPPDYASNRS
ncbi:hypothetical protein AAF712_010557 [Marasmius tenuissimus]|uniref:Uncharacterized protein n=1 Tax=Marasmius tenuissimus TaxID=585030 RepID=A0ABR2ZMD9_9AGAR